MATDSVVSKALRQAMGRDQIMPSQIQRESEQLSLCTMTKRIINQQIDIYRQHSGKSDCLDDLALNSIMLVPLNCYSKFAEDV